MALIQYARATISVDGQELLEEASLSLDFATNSQPVLTVRHGYNGETPGAPQVTLNCSNAVPTAAIEFQPEAYELALSPSGGKGGNGVKFVISIPGGQTFQFDGFIISSNFSHGVNESSKITFTARGLFNSTWE